MSERVSYDPVLCEDLATVDTSETVVHPLEVDLQLRSLDFRRDDRLFSWKDPWFLTTVILGGMMMPSLVGAVFMVYELTGRIWPAFPFSVHLTLGLWELCSKIPSDDDTIPGPSLCRRCFSAILDTVLFFKVYPAILDVLIHNLLTDFDGTVVTEYVHYDAAARLLRFMGWTIGVSRLALETCSFVVIGYHQLCGMHGTEHQQEVRMCNSCIGRDALRWSELDRSRLRRTLRWITHVLFLVSLILLFWSTTSILVHWGTWSAPSVSSRMCDPLDTTECILPFPSMEFMVPDNTTDTGWRVNIHPDVLPRLKGRIKLHPAFLNELDGFSTMAPILFYLEGLKEAQENGNNRGRLQGPQHIANSLTPASITALIDVGNMTLVPHSAEIDYLDTTHPLVMVFPSKPLRHNTHYALAVLGARDAQGELLPPSPGMDLFLSDENKNSPRRIRYRDKVRPALEVAAPWSRTEPIQLVFDFQTISEKSQLGVVRGVRDATLMEIEAEDWDWNEHVDVIRIDESDCSRADDLVARTIHAKLDVPWFLREFGKGHRASVMDKEAVLDGKARILGNAHFVVHVPCSVRASALHRGENASLRAFVDFGHGLFYSRAEASWETLLRMANKNGYIVMAMDWRGMSRYDLLVVVKTLMSKPSLFQAVRDNLIQGYANKIALQHFSMHGMLTLDWMSFDKNPIPLHNDQQPSSIFYGISQGGILGAGYTTLLGSTKLLDRAILGVPGTPFALVLSRSMDFAGYDAIMLLNFYNNRHVRIFLSFAQMLWDSCEGAGLLAPPLQEGVPRILIQAGLGDTVVPTIAAEALSRALGAVILPNNPRREIYDIKTEPAAEGESLGPRVTLTELLFKKENASLPVSDDYSMVNDNEVHWCVREDTAMIEQIEEFINSGRIIDVCKNDRCVREDSNSC
ncbi:hypothetical protein MHU86_17166 [Fragilaria crotonensis]|nr:hypothetical protein MHU86_17166 [Fragilaria crotonensis]